MSNQDPISFLKLQAKKFYKDWETHTEIIENGKVVRFEYHPKFFPNIDYLFQYFNFSFEDQKDFSLMKAQHIIAQMSALNKWTDLIKQEKLLQELAKESFIRINKQLKKCPVISEESNEDTYLFEDYSEAMVEEEYAYGLWHYDD